jgi:hypothetical protein
MKIKDGFILREIAGSYIVVPIGERVVDFNGIITLSETGAFLWKHIQTGNNEEDLITALLDEYEIDTATACADVTEFLNSMKSGGLMEDD